MTNAIQEIQQEDTSPPLFTAPADITILCDQDPNNLGLTGDVIDESDNCEIIVGEATYSDSLSLETACDGHLYDLSFLDFGR